ncbi:uncharacterized protein N7496_004495 [Penicillium cataractarum]|uniref:Arrestin-like N-terminal domain-containing protein n=1 Tax=Penicillium cataractarum TaxID=2100454 RepID=A0A9W9SPG2_9EURO|nr:uncharacterized protein N7496_004495 [Penicillium cataractarum]KAJ5382067.1 hypothetical protein N7496_004495 [Penicillium cataractarum]
MTVHQTEVRAQKNVSDSVADLATCKKYSMESLGDPVSNCRYSSHAVGMRGELQLSFILLEPVVYLQGDGKSDRHAKNHPAISRGYLHLKLTKPTKIKSICVSFHGVARLQPLGESSKKQDLITSGITYLEDGHATFSGGYHNLCDESIAPTETRQIGKGSAPALCLQRLSPPEYDPGGLDRSGYPGTGSGSPRHTNYSRSKGNYTVFPVGDYTYSFEFLLHDSLPETISTELISVHYYLEAKIELPGIFHSQMRSQLDVPVLRLPLQNSLELTEPILVSKDWREQLHYDACILGKSFRLGSRIPIRLTLTPSVDLKCCWLKVYVSQHMQYWKTGRETRLLHLGQRKVLLFEKQAGNEYKSTFSGSKFRIASERDMKRPTDTQTRSLLGAVQETRAFELEVQLPRCPELKERPRWQQLHPSTRAGKPDVNHWIQVRSRETCSVSSRLGDRAIYITSLTLLVQIVLCLSKEDRDETAGKKQNSLQFLTMEAPITVLSCKATSSNIYVPPYSVEYNTEAMPLRYSECDCVGSDFTATLAPLHKVEVQETLSVEPILPDDLTGSLGFESSCNDIKPPPRAHMTRFSVPEVFQ